MKISICDVAELAGVSPSTVSNVRTGKKHVSPELVEKVNAAIRELNYVPNLMASGLRGKKTNLIGVVLPSFSHPSHTSILKGIQDSALNTNYTICASPTFYNQTIEKKCLQQLRSSMPDALIISSYAMKDNPDGRECLDLLQEIASKDEIPVISLERNLEIPGTETILYSNQRSSFQMVEYLIKQGHKKIGHICGPMDFAVSQKRYNGYEKAMQKHGLNIDFSWIQIGSGTNFEGYTGADGYRAMRKLLDTTDVTAVFAANDELAIGAIKAIKDCGLRVPQDIAVTGFDNIFVGTLTNPSLTTVNVPTYRMGTMAFERVLKRLDGENIHETPVYLKTNIVIRESSDINVSTSWDIQGW